VTVDGLDGPAATPLAEPVRPERFWDLLSPYERSVVERSGVKQRHPYGTVLLREGEPARSVLVLLSGRVKIVAAGSGGRPSLLAVRVPGDILGELAAVDDGRRSASVLALEPVDVLRVPADRFVAILRSHAPIAYALLRVVGSRLRVANLRRVERRESLTTQRVAVVLSELAAEHGRMSTDTLTISLQFSQEELAMMAGASREQVVRSLRTLRDAGVIATGRQRVSVLRPDVLGHWAWGG
jgi:CRP-like cAMP-binding protein